MKTIIENFIALARKYEAYGKAMKLPDSFNEIGGDVRIYFDNNRKTCSVKFDYMKETEIEVPLYAKQISFPFTAKEETIADTYNRAWAFYASLQVNEEAAAQNERKAKVQELEKLRRQAEEIEKELQ